MRERLGKLQIVKNYLVTKHRSPKVFPDWAKIDPDLGYPSGRVFLQDKTLRQVISGADLPFVDHFEMCGRVASHIISYIIFDDNTFDLFLHSTYPNFRTKPKATEGSYSHNFTIFSKVLVDGSEVTEKVKFIDILGKLTFISEQDDLIIKRTFLPAVYTTALIEKIEVENISQERLRTIEVTVPVGEYISLQKYSLDGKAYLSRIDIADSDGKMMMGLDEYKSTSIAPNQKATFYACYYTRPTDEDILVDCIYEEKKRTDFINSISNGIRLECPETILNALFTHAVLHGSEAILDTKNGLMHCPLGGNYYGAVWTNDNVEYSAPFFGYAGIDLANKAITNVLRMFKEEVDLSKFNKARHCIPTSIYNCGDNVWTLAGDRGDSQMFASGACRFLLALGDRELAEEFSSIIDHCIEYSKSKTDKKGRVLSDSDELEGRFPHGKANLSTNCLAYDMYLNASFLASTLNTPKKYEYFNLASKQRNSIIKNFKANVNGYDTFKYFESNKILRAWACMPISVGIKDNAEDTIEALFSPEMYSRGYMKTALNRKTTWDRSLLFAIKGGFKAGKTEKMRECLLDYSFERFLGFHAPYPFEAFPEGNCRQLSAESILFARIFTEGVLGLSVTGFGAFSITPNIPKEWDKFAIRHIVLANMPIDVEIDGNVIRILDQMKKVIKEKNFVNGQKLDINLFE